MSSVSESSLKPLYHRKMLRLLLAWLFLNSFPLLLVSSHPHTSTHSIRVRGVRSLTHQRPLRSLGHTAKCRRFVFAPACRGIMSKRGDSIRQTSPNQMTEEQPIIPWVFTRFTRSIEYGPPHNKGQPTIISLKLPKKVGAKLS